MTVLQLVQAFEAVTETTIPYESLPRREGDIVSMYANASLAEKELKWKAKFNLEDMCKIIIIENHPG